MAERQKVFKEIETLYKLTTPLNVKNMSVDAEMINKEKDKVDKNKIWLKRLGEDIFIDESVKVLNKMIAQDNLARLGSSTPQNWLIKVFFLEPLVFASGFNVQPYLWEFLKKP